MSIKDWIGKVWLGNTAGCSQGQPWVPTVVYIILLFILCIFCFSAYLPPPPRNPQGVNHVFSTVLPLLRCGPERTSTRSGQKQSRLDSAKLHWTGSASKVYPGILTFPKAGSWRTPDLETPELLFWESRGNSRSFIFPIRQPGDFQGRKKWLLPSETLG